MANFLFFVVGLAVIDIKHQSLPNVLTVPGMGVGIVCSLLGLTIPLRHSLFGIAVGGAVILIIHLITKGGMGMGDMKLLAMIGSFLGPWQSLQTLFWGSLFGSIFGVAYLIKTKQGRKTPIPFGPFLSLGALIALFRII